MVHYSKLESKSHVYLGFVPFFGVYVSGVARITITYAKLFAPYLQQLPSVYNNYAILILRRVHRLIVTRYFFTILSKEP